MIARYHEILIGSMMLMLTVIGCSQDAPKTTTKLTEAQVAQVYYLEIVTEDVDAVCADYTKAIGARFGEPVALLGNARITAMPGGGRLGVRAPLRATEEPVVRPYWLVNDIEASVAAAVAAGAEVAHPPLEIPGHGTFAIYFHGGVQHGLWQK